MTVGVLVNKRNVFVRGFRYFFTVGHTAYKDA
jgi:hypothetical protein